MNKLVQYREAELVELLRQDLTAKGLKVGTNFNIEFVTNTQGETLALVTGVDDEADVQESKPAVVRVVDGEDLDVDDLPEQPDLRQLAYSTMKASLTSKGHTVDELNELVLEELKEKGLPTDTETEREVRVGVIKSLQHLQKQKKAEYVDDGELELWRKPKGAKKIPRVTKLSTAAQIVEGNGGVMDRGDALSEGASEGRPRQGARRKKTPRRGRGGGGSRGPGNGTPFSF